MASRCTQQSHRWHPTHVEECFGYLRDFLAYASFDRSAMSFMATCDIQHAFYSLRAGDTIVEYNNNPNSTTELKAGNTKGGTGMRRLA
eukprot:6491514-Amphidinium_carterae.1